MRSFIFWTSWVLQLAFMAYVIWLIMYVDQILIAKFNFNDPLQVFMINAMSTLMIIQAVVRTVDYLVRDVIRWNQYQPKS